MVVFWCPQVAWQFQTLIRFPPVRGPWNKKLKKHLSDWARCQKAIDGSYFTKKWRAETLQPGLEFDSIKPRLKSGIFKCISWLNSSFLGGDDRGLLKEGVKTFQMAQCRVLTRRPSFFLHIYSLWTKKALLGMCIIRLECTCDMWEYFLEATSPASHNSRRKREALPWILSGQWTRETSAPPVSHGPWSGPGWSTPLSRSTVDVFPAPARPQTKSLYDRVGTLAGGFGHSSKPVTYRWGQ